LLDFLAPFYEKAVYLDGPNVATDLATGELLVERIFFEHILFTAPLKIATEAVLGHLFTLASQKEMNCSQPKHWWPGLISPI
jgi:hypothetical protein